MFVEKITGTAPAAKRSSGLRISLSLLGQAKVSGRNGGQFTSISSGSFKTMGMIVAPCSVRSASEIANGVTSTLLTRAADVVLKERKTLLLMVRETPLHLGHLRTLTALAEIGAIITPPVPAFYARPASLDDMIGHTIGRLLDHFDIELGTVRRWKDPDSTA